MSDDHPARLSPRLSELARRAINAAQTLAATYDQGGLTMCHLLWALSAEQRGLSAALLHEHGLDAVWLRQQIESGSAPNNLIDGVLAQAERCAEQMGNHYVGTEHLLLALALDPGGAALLQAYGVEPGIISQRLDAALHG